MRNLDIDVVFTEICRIKERERSRRKVGDFYMKMVKKIDQIIYLVASQKKTTSELVLFFYALQKPTVKLLDCTLKLPRYVYKNRVVIYIKPNLEREFR